MPITHSQISVLTIGQWLWDTMRDYISHEPATPDECLGRNDIYCITVPFGNGKSADLELVCRPYEPGRVNRAWVEVTLYDKNDHVEHHLVRTEMQSSWKLYDKDTEYVIIVRTDPDLMLFQHEVDIIVG